MVENFLERFSFRFFHIVSTINAPPCSVATSRRTTFPIPHSVAGSTRIPGSQNRPCVLRQGLSYGTKKEALETLLFCRFRKAEMPPVYKKTPVSGSSPRAWTQFPLPEKNRIAGLANGALTGPRWVQTLIEGTHPGVLRRVPLIVSPLPVHRHRMYGDNPGGFPPLRGGIARLSRYRVPAR